MNIDRIVSELAANGRTFHALLAGSPKELYRYTEHPGAWCVLEIVCHLYDEEREDFRARTEQVLRDPAIPLVPIDPTGWVQQRRYIDREFATGLEGFLNERERSVAWLRSLTNARWENVHRNPTLGPMTARSFLTNWLAHDYLHLRQILRIKHNYLQTESGESLSYAGTW